MEGQVEHTAFLILCIVYILNSLLKEEKAYWLNVYDIFELKSVDISLYSGAIFCDRHGMINYVKSVII